MVPYAICNGAPVIQGKLLSDYKDQGVYMINYRPADTPASDLSEQIGMLLVMNGWLITQGTPPRYITQLFFTRNNATLQADYHRFYVRNGTQKSDGSYMWDAIGWIRVF